MLGDNGNSAAETRWVSLVCRVEPLNFLKRTQRPLKPLLSLSNEPLTQFPPGPCEDFYKGVSNSEDPILGLLQGLRSHWPHKPALTLVSHLDVAQISTIILMITLLHFLVLMAASQGHVLLTSISSS